MTAFWDPIALPSGFDFTRVEMLGREFLPYGARIYAHWQNRNQLVTSKIEMLTESLAENFIANFEELTLSLAAGLRSEQYRQEIAKFSAEVTRRAHDGPRPYERVPDRQGRRIHLARPFESIAACGLHGLSDPTTTRDLTCKGCIRAALKHIDRIPDPLEFVELRPEEISHSKKVASQSTRRKRSWTIDNSQPVLEFLIDGQPITIDLRKVWTTEYRKDGESQPEGNETTSGQIELPLD